MSNRPIAGLFALLLLCMSALSTAAFAANTKAIGGNGGWSWFDNCRDGDALVGINYAAGKDVDYVIGICALMRDGKPNQDENYRLMVRGQSHEGGPFGAEGTLRCAPGMVVQRLSATTSAAHLVHHFALRCANLLTGERTSLGWSSSNGGAGGASGKADCGDGSYAYGLLGRSSDRVIALGLMCTTFQPPVVAPPPPCPEGQIRLQGGCQPPPLLPGTTTGTGGGFIQMFPTTSATFTGNWSVASEDAAYKMSMTQTGNAVSGSYRGNDGSQGSFSGTVQGNVLRFKWTQTDGFAGTGKFTLASDGNTFDGSYNFGTNPDVVEGQWGGSRS